MNKLRTYVLNNLLLYPIPSRKLLFYMYNGLSDLPNEPTVTDHLQRGGSVWNFDLYLNITRTKNLLSYKIGNNKFS